jgi:hypothetical protein
MPIIVEDGSQVAGANSYISESFLTVYAEDRGITLTQTASALIYRSMSYVETRNYKGNKASETQSLQWPRENVYIDGYLFPDDQIPIELQNAQAETCLSIDQGNDPAATTDRAVKREKVDVLEVEYMDNASSKPTYTSINVWLDKLLQNGSGSGSIRLLPRRG